MSRIWPGRRPWDRELPGRERERESVSTHDASKRAPRCQRTHTGKLERDDPSAAASRHPINGPASLVLSFSLSLYNSSPLTLLCAELGTHAQRPYLLYGRETHTRRQQDRYGGRSVCATHYRAAFDPSVHETVTALRNALGCRAEPFSDGSVRVISHFKWVMYRHPVPESYLKSKG